MAGPIILPSGQPKWPPTWGTAPGCCCETVGECCEGGNDPNGTYTFSGSCGGAFASTINGTRVNVGFGGAGWLDNTAMRNQILGLFNGFSFSTQVTYGGLCGGAVYCSPPVAASNAFFVGSLLRCCATFSIFRGLNTVQIASDSNLNLIATTAYARGAFSVEGGQETVNGIVWNPVIESVMYSSVNTRPVSSGLFQSDFCQWPEPNELFIKGPSHIASTITRSLQQVDNSGLCPTYTQTNSPETTFLPIPPLARANCPISISGPLLIEAPDSQLLNGFGFNLLNVRVTHRSPNPFVSFLGFNGGVVFGSGSLSVA